LTQSEYKLTHLNEFGEFGLIKALTKNFTAPAVNVTIGIGDDAAVIKNDSEKLMLVSTDLFIENVNFDLMYTPLKHLGYKVVSAAISDILAMNGRPTQILTGIAASSKYTFEALEELYSGIQLACKDYKITLIGGDTTTTPAGLTISLTALGEVESRIITARNTAQEFDLICVSGDLGGAFLGLNILEREKRIFLENPEIQPDLSDSKYAVERQLKPVARVDVIETLKELDVKPTAMIDISDGLTSEIMHICTSSNVGCNIYEEKIPIDPEVIRVAKMFNLDAVTCAINGGEDYELLFTVKQSDFEKIKNSPDLTIIGHITSREEGLNFITTDGQIKEIIAKGWQGE
jgi:thiamine-monophosphate kinase